MNSRILFAITILCSLTQVSCGMRKLTPATRVTSQTMAQTDMNQSIDNSKNDLKNEVLQVSQFQLSGPLECCSFNGNAVFIRQCIDFDPLVCNKMTK